MSKDSSLRFDLLCFLVVLLLSSCNPGTKPSDPVIFVDDEPTANIPSVSATLPTTEDPNVVRPSPTFLSPTGTEKPTSTPGATNTPSRIGPDIFPQNVNPLTGLVVEDPQKLERRPVLIKVSNYPAYLRPHSGLSLADMVFSYYIGEGMTRYLALFYAQDVSQVGPMRSGRLIDPQIVNLYGGFLGMVGADKTVWAEIAKALPGRFLTEMPVNCPALCNNGDGTAFANTEAFTERVRELGLDDERPALPGMIFDTEVPTGGVKANSFWIYFSYYNQVRWDYDLGQGAYLRSQEEAQSDETVELKPMTDRLTGEQLAFENIVILFAWHNIIKPELIAIELQSIQDGKALLLRDGHVFEITYTAASPITPIRFFGPDGNPIAFKPGTTWVEIVGLGTTVEEIEPGTWKVRFYP
jgi:hypothetical protein